VRLVIFQVLRELLLNIFKHSGQDRAEIEVGCEDDWITLFVKDSGQGFDPRILQDSLNEGIGLSSIAERMEAIHGHWEVESAPGGGARFRIWFPAVRKLAQGESNKKSLVRLLVADDHKMVREGIASLLEEQPDFVVVGEARNGEEAIELADQLEPDVVIMDVEMPKLDGIQATREILKQQPDTSVVGLSMHEDKGYAEKMKQAGAAAHEDKATASVHLIKAIRRVFKEKIGRSSSTPGPNKESNLRKSK
jgi:CheY-like chemotaxis protein